ncbi:MAG: hypothetical protein HY721_05910 [Planctomycetes bacterium]|nr:hypothetical protein [Planctomycetota bacterium]
MSQKAKRGIAAMVIVGGLAGLGIYVAVAVVSPAATAQSLPDTGRFRAGSELGAERAGFSGRTMVTVFTSAAAPEWPAIAECLGSAAVTAETDPYFVGILVDETLEPEVEKPERDAGARVIVRALNGAFLGGLPAGFTCAELVELLKSLRQRIFFASEKSPIYANLLERPEAVVDAMVLAGEALKAARYVAFLEELEGAGSLAVQAAKGRLGQ